jgi:hypothetical protein
LLCSSLSFCRRNVAPPGLSINFNIHFASTDMSPRWGDDFFAKIIALLPTWRPAGAMIHL